MIYGMYLSTMGAMVQSSRHASTANNLANSNTVGFKPDWTQFQVLPAESELQGSHRRAIDGLLEQTGGGVWLDKTVTDFTAGNYRPTGNPLSLALNDENGKTRFFVVQNSADNQAYLTRAGNFVTNSDGQLMTDTGFNVLDGNGMKVTIPDGVEPRVLNDGSIRDEISGQVIAQVGVMSTDEPHKMKKIGDSLFDPQDAQVVNDQNGVLGGTLEESSSNTITEMVNMIEGHRMYESNMKFLSMQDETLGTVVSRIGKIA